MDEYVANFKRKKKSVSNNIDSSKKTINLKVFISRFLLAVIFFLLSIIFTNISDKNLFLYKEYVFTESLPFTKVKSWYEDLFGEVLPKDDNVKTVFDGKLVYKEIKDYLEGEALTVGANTLVNNITSGIVVFSGEKEGYGNTVIIQGVDGIDIWYGNLTNVAVKLYDYVDSGTILGETSSKELYLVIKKDNEFLKYEEYKS